MEVVRDAKPWKLPPALDHYKSIYMKDYTWPGDFHSSPQTHVPLPLSLDKYKSVYMKDYGWRSDFHSPVQAHVPKPAYPPVADVPRCYLPWCQPSDLTPGRAGKLEILAEPMHDLSCYPAIPPLAARTEESFVPRQLPFANLVTYQQFAQDLYREGLSSADKNKAKNQSSSVLIQVCPDVEWKSVYKQDYLPWTGAPAEPYTEMSPSRIFPEDSRYNYSRWVSEYADSYSIFLKKLDWSSPIAGQWLPFGKDARWTPRWREPTP